MASTHGSSRHVLLASLALLLAFNAVAHVAEAAAGPHTETAFTNLVNRRLLSTQSTQGSTRSLYDCDDCRVTQDNGLDCRQSWETGVCCNSGDNADYCYIGGTSGVSCNDEFNDLYNVAQCCGSCSQIN